MTYSNQAAFQPNVGDTLAIDPKSIGALFLLEPPPDFEQVGTDAVLTIRGPLMHHLGGWFDSYEAIRGRFDAAMKSDAKRVVMRIDSPGGYVSGCFELARYMRAESEKRGKKLVAHVDGQVTSAAYALACAAEEIVASPTSIVGSIGVISVVGDMSEAWTKIGVRFHVLTSGERKADGHPFKKPSEDALKAMQADVDEFAEVFFDWVAESRTDMPIKTIRDLEAGIRIGESALKAGLVDRIEDGSQPLGSGTDDGDATAFPKERSNMDKAISLALACAEDATEAAVLASATKIVGERDALFSILGVESVEEAKGAVEAMRADKAALEAANAKLAEVSAAKAAKEREDLLASASKLFSPAKMESLKEESVDFIRKFVSMATPDIRPESMGAVETKVGRVLTARQKRAAESAGMTEEEFAAELDRIDDGGAQ